MFIYKWNLIAFNKTSLLEILFLAAINLLNKTIEEHQEIPVCRVRKITDNRHDAYPGLIKLHNVAIADFEKSAVHRLHLNATICGQQKRILQKFKIHKFVKKLPQ